MVIVIADDFTGAGDVGVQIHKYGIKVRTCIGDPTEKLEEEVIVLDTDTRNKNEKFAYEKIKNLMESIKDIPNLKLYKKIDSTLRGNIRVEINAILDVIEKENKVCIIVGFPKMKRQIINGIHLLDGQRLSKTEFANDPVSPVKEDNLMKIFPEAHLVSSENLNEKNMNDVVDREERVIIFDTKTEDDLNFIAENLIRLHMDNYIVGSAGLMNYLPKYWGYEKKQVMLISGSCSLQNVKQIRNLQERYSKEIYFFKINFEKSIAENWKEFERNYQSRKDIFIYTYLEKEDSEKVIRALKKQDEKAEDISEIVGEYVRELAQNVMKKCNIKNIFLTGGETAVKVLKRLDIKFLEIVDEIDTGVVYSVNKNAGYRVITKPGAFGEDKIYLKAYEKLKSVENIN